MADVVLKVFRRIEDRFPHLDERSEMNAGFQMVLAGDSRHELPIANLARIEWNVCRQRGPVAPRRIGQHHDLLPFFEQAFNRYASDVAAAACDEDRHGSSRDLLLAKRFNRPEKFASTLTESSS